MVVGYVTIEGFRCPILGGPMLDYTLVDASALPGSARGRLAQIIGPGVTAGAISSAVGDSEEHVLVRLSPELPRMLTP